MSQELPKQVFLDGCRQVSAWLEPIGFLFAKSGPHASRRAGDWTFKISFQSSNVNVAGEYVELTVHASVCSKALKEWDEGSAWPADASDWVAGGATRQFADAVQMADVEFSGTNYSPGSNREYRCQHQDDYLTAF
ncbi:hypothetical protein FJ987_11490 [Mesorhizobium sp. CU2]|uniref:hypothetical protein n=1 Tax=unclassified Mesorhizobium TaxID=325217 RepID=UPI0011291B22|nr:MULTISPECIES: hypothetical protein [unclassified Mesorhizobium]TPN79450.1 hypothetical protein FJ988_23975 [Mesorhizobium sp. CU3]TPO15966.1 hypothetical protein FJ987_11490 [Mesorhizobium sp. CU2]